MKIKVVKSSIVLPNTWNPNRMESDVFEATVQSLSKFGIVTPTVVRTHPEHKGKYEVVDGEHRCRVLKEICARVAAGTMTVADDAEYSEEKGWVNPLGLALGENDVVPALRKYIDTGEMPVIDLGDISAAHAKRLTVVLNETKGSPEDAELSKLLNDIERTVGGKDAFLGMPYSEEDLEKLLSIDGEELDAIIDDSFIDEPKEEKEFSSVKFSINRLYKESFKSIVKNARNELIDAGESVPDDEGELYARVFFYMADRCCLDSADDVEED